MPHFDCVQDPPHPGAVAGVRPEIIDAIWLLERAHLASAGASGVPPVPTVAAARRTLFELIAGTVRTEMEARVGAVLAREDLARLAAGAPPLDPDPSEVIAALATRIQKLEAACTTELTTDVDRPPA